MHALMRVDARSVPSCACPGAEHRRLAHRFLHELRDPCLGDGGQLRQSEARRPHGSFVELRVLVEAERRIPRLELAALWKKQMILPACLGALLHRVSFVVGNPSYELPAEAVRLADFWLSLMAGSSLRVLGLMTSC